MDLDFAHRMIETSDGREISYRRFGHGPPAVLIHASPRSSAAVMPLGRKLAEQFTVFALDSPGFGYSQPLRAARPDGFDFGAALIECFDALGLDRAPVYGTHTGAVIAAAAAMLQPERISALSLDGYPVFSPMQQTEYAEYYLTPLRPDWAGTHLAWLWSRVKDQFTVFPWHLMGDWARLPRPLPPPEYMQQVVVDLLAAGDAYRLAYAAAFRFDARAAARSLAVPTVVMARSDDLLFGHLDLLEGLPPSVVVRKLGSDDSEWAQAVAGALRAGGTGAVPPLTALSPPFRGARFTHNVVHVPGCTVAVTSCGLDRGRKLVLLPGLPGSVAGETALLRALGFDRPTLGIDLPGFGASALAGTPSVDGMAAAMHDALRQLGISEYDIVAIGESASIGCALAALMPSARLAIVDPVPDTERAALVGNMTEIAPRRDGAHLLAAWHELRDRRLWRPWYAPTPENAYTTEPDVEALSGAMVDWMRGGIAGATTVQAALRPALAKSIAAIAARTIIITIPVHPWTAVMAYFAAKHGVPFREAKPERMARATSILEALR